MRMAKGQRPKAFLSGTSNRERKNAETFLLAMLNRTDAVAVQAARQIRQKLCAFATSLCPYVPLCL
ncbi:MAG: hypothetical protein WA151_23640, partial [Desulfatirhabdiaceae bacterium]